MTVATDLSRPGQSKGTGDENVLFLKLFAGEVLSAFQNMTTALQRTKVKDVKSGKSAQFPATWKATPKYHVAGQNLITNASNYLSDIQSMEKEIFVDNPLIASTLVPEIDELKNHWDERSEYVNALAESLAQQADKNVLGTLFAAANAAANFSGGFAGHVSTISGGAGGWDAANVSGSNVTKVVDEFFVQAALFDKAAVPSENRYAALRPETYYDILAFADDLVDKDFNSAGNADRSAGTVRRVAGFELVKTANLPAASDEAAATGEKNDPFGAGKGYTSALNAEHVVTLWHPSAVGTVRLMGIEMETDYKSEYQATLLLAKYAMGHNILRPEAAGRIITSA